MDSYDYDPTRHHLVINGDGATWITSCRDYFQKNATFVIDCFHVTRDIQRIFRKHPRYRVIRRKLSEYDVDALKRLKGYRSIDKKYRSRYTRRLLREQHKPKITLSPHPYIVGIEKLRPC